MKEAKKVGLLPGMKQVGTGLTLTALSLGGAAAGVPDVEALIRPITIYQLAPKHHHEDCESMSTMTPVGKATAHALRLTEVTTLAQSGTFFCLYPSTIKAPL